MQAFLNIAECVENFARDGLGAAKTGSDAWSQALVRTKIPDQ